MGKIGKCCCQGSLCCCIERIDVDFAVPTPGQPGASIGNWGWNVDSLPTETESTQIIDGVPRLVSTCIYNAPTTTICIPPDYEDIPNYALSYNTYFLTLERFVPADYFSQPAFNEYWWFEGTLRWKVYAYVKDLVLRVERRKSEGLSRLRLTGDYFMTRERQFTGTLRRYDSTTCAFLGQISLGGEFLHKPCGRQINPEVPCNLVSYFSPGQTQIQKVTGYGIFMDTGWVPGDCNAIPTLSTAEPGIFGGYNSTSPPGICRVPSGANRVTYGSVPGGCSSLPSNFFAHVETYTPDTLWFATYPFYITPCAAEGVSVPPRIGLFTVTQSPVVTVFQNLEVGAQSLSITPFEPEVISRYQANPVSVELTLTPSVPTITASQSAVPDTETLIITVFAPTLGEVNVVVPGTTTVLISSQEPDVVSDVLVSVPDANLYLLPLIPSARLPVVVEIPSESLTITTYNASLNESIEVVAGTESLSLTTFAPDLAMPLVVTPDTDTKTTTGFAPHVTTPQTITPATQSLTLATFGPTIINPVETTPATATLVVSALTPSALTPVVVTPPTLALVIDTETTCELILTTYPPDVSVDSVVGCSCEDPSGTGTFVGDSTVTGCTTDCPGGSCTYLWTGSEWCFLDTTCVPVEGDFNLPPYPACD